MSRKVFIFLFLFVLPSSSYAQTKTKYTPKLPSFFEGEKPRGELISVEPIVATKKNTEESTDSFAVTNNSSEKPVMGNPLGIIPKKKQIIAVVQEEPKKEEPRDASTAELEQAVQDARNVSEEIRKAMGDKVDYTNPNDINKFVNASEKALQRGQLKTKQTSNNEQDYKF